MGRFKNMNAVFISRQDSIVKLFKMKKDLNGLKAVSDIDLQCNQCHLRARKGDADREIVCVPLTGREETWVGKMDQGKTKYLAKTTNLKLVDCCNLVLKGWF